MKNKILIVPVLAAIMVFAAVGPGHTLSPYVPNYFSYDPEWTGDLPKFGGYINGGVWYSHVNDEQFNFLGAEQVSFYVDRAELYLQHRATDWADGYVEVSITGFNASPGQEDADAVARTTGISLDEAWLRVVIPWGSGLTLLGGVYDVPIGIGANDNIDVWNWSFKMVNLLVAPWAITGILAEYEIGFANINFWIGNDWGYSEAYGKGVPVQNSGRANYDTEALYGGRIGFAPNEMFDVGISVVWANRDPQTTLLDEPFPDLPWQSQLMVDLDFEWLDLPDSLGCLNFELWWMEITDTPTWDYGVSGLIENSQAYGGVAQFNFATPMESLSISLAYELVYEENGIVFGADPNAGIPVPNQTRQSVEVSPIWAIGDHVVIGLSWRSDWSNKDVFTNADGEAKDFAWFTAWEWYYYF